MKMFSKTAYDCVGDLMYGQAKHPLKLRSGMILGAGTVYPELNFTLPTMKIEEATLPEIRTIYGDIIRGATTRAVELEVPGLVIEFETLPPMCEHPEWGIELTKILLDGLRTAEDRHGLRSTLRITPNDLREMHRPPLMRRGEYLHQMLQTFDGTAAAGAELLSIESIGGKETHDEALTNCDLPSVIFSLCVLGVRDMRFLWTEIAKIAERHGAISAGDTACGFGNTAMVLAEKQYIPRVFAAVVRAITAVRSLVAYECGAVGPGKDCGYENVILKAITGFPMAMEGKTAACAHFSPVGNIAAACCDTWSNESVQHLKLLAGMAPTCSLEQLIYDCRLMNVAAADGGAGRLRDWLVRSDAGLDPQAWVLAPVNALRIAAAIVAAPDHYQAGLAAAREAIACIRGGLSDGLLRVSDREKPWLDTLTDSLDAMPATESAFIDRMMAEVDTTRFLPAEYGL
jgi:methanol--5-hydroxybenzimidazolylcobamide Co-methyltransferase